MKTIQAVAELLDSEIEADDDQFVCRRRIGSHLIEFAAIEDDNGDWDISFSTPFATGHSLTGDGHSLQVFAFVRQCWQRFIRDYRPQVMVFNTTDKKAKAMQGLALRAAGDDYVLNHSQQRMLIGDRPAVHHFFQLRRRVRD